MRDLFILATAITCVALPGCSKNDKQSAEKKAPEPAATKPADPGAATAQKKPEPAAKQVKAIPDGYHTVTPMLTVKSIEDAIGFYSKVFAAKTLLSMPGPDGKLVHAEIQIGDSHIMIGAEMSGQSKSPDTLKGTTGSLLVYVEDVDAVTKSAIEAGAKELMKVDDQFWGDRWGMIIDPFGHAWGIATHKIEVPPEKMGELAKAWNPDAKKKPEIPGTPAKHWQPERMHTVVPSIHIAGGAAPLGFYEKALGAKVSGTTLMPDGKTLMHAELELGDSIVMVSGENPAMGSKSPKTLGGTPLALFVYTEDVDAAFARATAQSAEVKEAVDDQFWGDRFGSVYDPSRHEWGLATHKEDVSPAEMARRMKAMMGQAPDKASGGE